MSRSLYDILGVAPDAEPEAIRAAYERLSAGTSDPTWRMALKEAWLTLGQPQRRAAYDASRRQAGLRSIAPVEPERAGLPPLAWLGLAVALVAAAALGWRAHQQREARQHPATVVAAPVAVPVAAEPEAPAPARPRVAAPSGLALSPEDLFAKASASVVRVNVLNGNQGVAMGSGVVLGSGTVITNCHVARAGTRLKVLQGNDSWDASVDVADERHDLCRLSVPGLNAPGVVMGSVNQLRVGQKVYAIGSPKGLDMTLSDGLVSSLRQTPEGALIQTSAPISPGSSGGGLFTEEGLLVGIVTFQMASGQNLNFALPVDWVLRMGNSSRAEAAKAPVLPPMNGTPGGGGVAAGGAPPELLGAWTCFGPVTGRGIALVFGADGALGGQMEGKPLAGRFSLQGKLLYLFDASQGTRYQVEEMSAAKLVINAGSGRRLVCSR